MEDTYKRNRENQKRAVKIMLSQSLLISKIERDWSSVVYSSKSAHKLDKLLFGMTNTSLDTTLSQ